MRIVRFGRAIGLVVVLLAAARVEAQPAANAQDALRLERLCNACHLDEFETQARSPHRVLDEPERRTATGKSLGCLNCHTDAAQHAADGGGRGTVFAFREEPMLEQNGVCLGCHRATHPSFDRSPHALAGLTCTSCHDTHGDNATALLRTGEAARTVDSAGPKSRVCFDCHGAQFAELTLNEHHRVREGVLDCTSCHDPHAPATRSLLGGFKQQRCVECHTDKGGPFVFEHPASRVEGCTACHSPHGSPNRHMLAHQRVAELCLTCHAAIPAFHANANPAAPPRFGLDTQCTSCHSAIHGSNLHPRFLR